MSVTGRFKGAVMPNCAKAGRGMTAAKEKVMPNCGKAGCGMTDAKERVMPNQEKQVVA